MLRPRLSTAARFEQNRNPFRIQYKREGLKFDVRETLNNTANVKCERYRKQLCAQTGNGGKSSHRRAQRNVAGT